MRGRVALPLVLTTFACQKPAATPAAPSEVSEFCSAPERRAFDFWAGRWEVKIADGRVAGHNHIEIAHGGCALIEHWEAVDGGGGTSTNYFDPDKGKWVQNWVDSRGSIIQLEGGLVEGSMRLEGRWVPPEGAVQQMRGIWTPLEDGRVRQYFETSEDGETWKPWFEGFYSRQ